MTVTDGAAALPATWMRYGRSTVRLVGSNAWGAKSSATVTVYQLGKGLPSYWRYVLIDKSDFYLYYINGRRVVARYPIATGTPVGAHADRHVPAVVPAASPSSVWGVIRMPLQRKVHGGFVRTQYYVHGTNDPSSIGTMASHGCVRMYNRDVLRLAAQLRKYAKRPYTVIRY